jgi:hypothetical protein
MSDWFDEGGTGAPIDITKLLDSEMTTLLGDIVGLGALVSMGKTSDGGALGVTVTLDGRWRREYFRDVETAVNWLEGARAAVESSLRSAPASSGRRTRQRGTRTL